MTTPMLQQSNGAVGRTIRSLYMPDSCIQGDDFPAHIIWDRTQKLKIRVKCAASIHVKEVYNVRDQGRARPDRETTEYSDFVVNGYVGFVFHTDVLDNTFVRNQVTFDIDSEEGGSSELISKEIYLFRPAVELVKIPSELKIKYDANKGKWKLNDRIKIRNTGTGTAVVEIQLRPKGEFELGTPRNVNEFQTAFVNDLAAKLDILAKDFPKFSDVINEVLSLFKSQISYLDEDAKRRIKSAFEHFQTAVDEDSKLLDAFVSALVTSYIRNVSLITELATFREYLDSIGEGRVIILNSISSVKAKKPKAKLQMI